MDFKKLSELFAAIAKEHPVIIEIQRSPYPVTSTKKVITKHTNQDGTVTWRIH